MDMVLQFVCDAARRMLRPKRVLLFGSRARGDHQERSDYDIAFDFPSETQSEWSRFVLDMQESAPTLCELDLVNLRDVDPDFRERILAEGKEICPEASK